MPKTRKDIWFAVCEKIGGEKGRTLRAKLEEANASGKLDSRFNQELSEEDYASELAAAMKSIEHTLEWAQWPPVGTWDRRN